MNYNKYMKNIQHKINYTNSINPSTFDFSNSDYQSTFYNSHENGQVGNRPNLPSDYTNQTTRDYN